MPWSGTSSGEGLNAMNKDSNSENSIEIRTAPIVVEERLKFSIHFPEQYNRSVYSGRRCGIESGSTPQFLNCFSWGFGGHYGAFFDSERLRGLAGTITAPRLPTFRISRATPSGCLNIRSPDIQAS